MDRIVIFSTNTDFKNEIVVVMTHIDYYINHES